MLSITSNNIDIGGSTAELSRPGDLAPLQIGDTFYLINGSTNLLGAFASEGTIQKIYHGSLLYANVEFLRAGKDLVAEVKGFGTDPTDPTDGDIYGGGILGTEQDSSTHITIPLGNLENLKFNKKEIITAYSVYGGGIVGAYGDSSIGNVTDVEFTENTVTVNKISGGGILGVNGADTAMGDIKNIVFDGNVVTTQNIIFGGGIVGAFGGAKYDEDTGITSIAPAHIGDISGSTFINNIITTLTIDGGGIIGTYSGGLSAGSIGNISNSKFADNVVTAEGFILAGVVFSENDLLISNSQFTGNTATSSVETTEHEDTDIIVYGGAVTMDTSKNASRLIVTASLNQETIFQNNKITDKDGERYNAISFQAVYPFNWNTSLVDAVLDIQAFGTVSILDPIYVNQNNGKTFRMNVFGPGQFIWGGNNEIIVNAHNPINALNLPPGSNTTLVDGFKLTALNHQFNLFNGATLTIHRNTSISVGEIYLNGHLIFDLDEVNNLTDPMLSITSGSILIGGSTAELAHPGDIEPLKIADKFYLINGSTDLKGVFAGEGTTQTIAHGSLLEATVKFERSGRDLVAEVISKGSNPEDPGNPDLPTEGDIYGGGVRGEEQDSSTHVTIPLGDLENIQFNKEEVTTEYSVHGGGIVGAYGDSSIGDISNT
jgi:hypothetical protein